MRGTRNFCCGLGGGGGAGQKTDWTTFFQSSAYFTVYRGGPRVSLQRKLYFPKDQEGANIFQGGGGGPNANFYRNPYNL